LPKGKYTITLTASDSEGLLFCFTSDLDLRIRPESLGTKAYVSLGTNYGINVVADQFATFIRSYNKYYSIGETIKRFGIFAKNVEMINQHNAQNLPWKMDINEFADLTWEEFKVGRLGYSGNYTRNNSVNAAGLFTVPESVDWTKKGAVTDIKNQGQCGSSWAFSTTGSVEGAVEIKTGRLTSLSDQQLVDCSYSYGNKDCKGGLMDYAFNYIIGNGGLCSEAAYPYKAWVYNCLTSCAKESTIASYKYVAENDEDALKAAVAQQPVSVAIEADQSIQFYSLGVFSGSCGTALDHAVLVVGYGNIGLLYGYLPGSDYWKVKNSWGTSWGMQGYIWLPRNFQAPYGQCGIAMEPSYPIA